MTDLSLQPKVAGIVPPVMSRRNIQGVVIKLSAQIDQQYRNAVDAGDRLVLVPILNGALYFCADLSRELFTPHTIEYVQYRSYVGQESTAGQFVGWDTIRAGEISSAIEGAHVLLVDTILDTGNTLNAVGAMIKQMGPKSAKACVLIRRSTSPEPAFCGGVYKGEEFLYGYGLDVDGRMRHYAEVRAVE